MGSCSIAEVLKLADDLVKLEEKEVGIEKEKKLVTIINTRCPLLPAFDPQAAIAKMYGAYAENPLPTVDAGETDMLQTELKGFQDRKNNILSARRSPNAPLTPAENSRVRVIEDEISKIEGKLKEMM